MKRLALFIALFIVLAGAGIWYGVRSSGVTFDDVGALWRLPVATLVALGVLCVLFYVADMFRYRFVGRAVGVHVPWRATLDATIANFFFSWITPGAALGAPAAIVMLGRRGVPWDAAALIAFGKSLTGTAVLILLAFVVMALGLGPELDGGTLAVFTTGIGFVAAMLLVPIVGAIWPAASLRLIARLEAWLLRRKRGHKLSVRFCAGLRSAVERLAKLRTGGKLTPMLILLAHLANLGVLVAIATLLAHSFGAASIPHAIGISTVYAAFTYVAPTPGGAGISEAVGPAFYGSILSAHDAVVVVLLFRALTFYLHIVVGTIYLGIVGGTRQILERRKAA
ncbi:MAG: flippase-like domain-containing protein [Myxococcota bacterium]|nr:flippase-like domain-containing protein [Myxococcota bacterium]